MQHTHSSTGSRRLRRLTHPWRSCRMWRWQRQAAPRGPKLRNQQAIANQNTLIYLLINLRTLRRLASEDAVR